MISFLRVVVEAEVEGVVVVVVVVGDNRSVGMT